MKIKKNFKIVLIEDKGVGKSAIFKQFIGNIFHEEYQVSAFNKLITK